MASSKNGGRGALQVTGRAGYSAAATASPEEAPKAGDAATPSVVLPEAPEHRATAPVAPAFSVRGESMARVAQIQAAVMSAGYSSSPTAAAQALRQVEATTARGLHPSVAHYRAEALDYLRGLAKRAEGRAA